MKTTRFCLLLFSISTIRVTIELHNRFAHVQPGFQSAYADLNRQLRCLQPPTEDSRRRFPDT